MKIIGFDTETTGLKPMDGDKIIEIALLTYDSDTRKLIDKYVQRINPERPISAGAQDIHGITFESLVLMPKFKQIAHEVKSRLDAADLLVAHNLNFDAEFLICEFAACGLPIRDMPSIDTMTEARWACAEGKYPKLSELCFALGVTYDQSAAHAADYDVDVMMQCLWRGLDRGFYQLPAALKVAA
ncbi:3'-5' exonuclease [Undibacterium sp. RTI2.1]|uniref:3'-5' exonuclease n=1 Tax=unclassified Undibacterium TaxID=2630295 RepID=UPI002AB350A4|nr:MULTISPECIES: 3'-5' exonuclease [unclassified Undibacterium]MDY7537560.1 3'-5' exonuclease [Undibacterium sp. 5I1]MEB0029157.1 3'-5' exonuclease [Undibacterium sp. RTI2.1]MEB0115465.1 3'-5' exonuclease [Undibacterium sp. RTI2.2]MEB0231945.1 3'-5' exonuclease [Undibacterium sp. 10I3]MEB0256296.1 3'-5' exonuclease [Undibacterium sp. 5I1]